MESRRRGKNDQPAPVGAREAEGALQAAAAARSSITGSVEYPTRSLWLYGLSGFCIPPLCAVGAESVPSGGVSAALLALGIVGLVASGLALRAFEAHNGVRMTGPRSIGRIGLVFLAAMIAFLVAVAAIVHGTSMWWASLLAMPLSAAGSLLYAKAWLADLHRQAA